MPKTSFQAPLKKEVIHLLFTVQSLTLSGLSGVHVLNGQLVTSPCDFVFIWLSSTHLEITGDLYWEAETCDSGQMGTFSL